MSCIVRATVVLVLSASAAAAQAIDLDGGRRGTEPLPLAALTDTVEIESSLEPVRTGGVSRGPLITTLYASLAGLHAVDAYTTSRGLARGATELNPVMRGIVAHPTVLWTVKGGATAVSIAVAERLWRQKRRRLAIIGMVAANGIIAAAAAHNITVLRHQ